MARNEHLVGQRTHHMNLLWDALVIVHMVEGIGHASCTNASSVGASSEPCVEPQVLEGEPGSIKGKWGALYDVGRARSHRNRLWER